MKPDAPGHTAFWRKFHVGRWLRTVFCRRREIPDGLWHDCLQRYPFLRTLTDGDKRLLREFCCQFLAQKEFSGGNGFVITDEVAVEIAAQACLPLLHLGGKPAQALRFWYGDFVGIVVHPGAVIAPRQVHDGSGVVHFYREVVVGEAMQRGPLMLSWHDVRRAAQAPGEEQGDEAQRQHNVVIHEFAHKMDMAKGQATGCPALPPGFMGRRRAQAHALWQGVMTQALQLLRDQLALAERFGEPAPWLDAYAATSPVEFFAVACEAFFVHPQRFAMEMPQVHELFEAFFFRDDGA